jgi:anti-sigma regulatory factor (Ser/Thr protein kinase)
MQRFEFTLPLDARVLASLRETLTAWLERIGVPDEDRASVVLATHEAAANAIEHADSVEPVAIEARFADGTVSVEIRDSGRWKAQRHADELRGRGLLLIKKLVTDFEIQTHPSGTTLRLHYRI